MARISSISIDVSAVDAAEPVAAEPACIQVLYRDGALYLHGATYDEIRAWIRDVAAAVDASEARHLAKSAVPVEYAHAE